MIGILPCAGKSERIHGLPKYLLPVGDSYLLKMHVDAMKAAGCKQVMVEFSRESMAIGSYYTDSGDRWQADICGTMTQTVLSAKSQMEYYGIKDEPVLFGMPDTYFDCNEVYNYLRNTLNISDVSVDVAVAVCRARPDQHKQGGMVRFSRNQVLEVIDKPLECNFEYIWGALAWKTAYWDCLTPDMPHVGYGLPVAIERELNVRAVVCEGNFYDCGTPERYFEMIRATTCTPISL